eukprot:SAG31_NODE_6231_length_2108_cov_6.782057_2_plen_69_part_01
MGSMVGMIIGISHIIIVILCNDEVSFILERLNYLSCKYGRTHFPSWDKPTDGPSEWGARRKLCIVLTMM